MTHLRFFSRNDVHGKERQRTASSLRSWFPPLTLALCSWLCGCTPNQDPNLLTLGGTFEFTSQDPSRDGDLFQKLQVIETLLEVDASGNLVPALAASWQVSADQRQWRLQLRPNVQFHDGSVLDAEAVTNSLRLARSKPGVFNNVPLADIQSEGTNVVVLTLTEPYSLLGAVLAHDSSAIVAKASFNNDSTVAHLYGTGPFQIAALDPPHSMRLARFAAYWGKPASVAQVLYLTGHRAESRALQVMSGQTDIIFTLDPASKDLLARQPNIVVDSQLVPRTVQLKLNSGHRFLNDVRARRALSLALDRSGLAKHISREPGTEANQLISAFFADYHLAMLPTPARDLAAAQALLAELGWHLNAAGLLERNGETFTLTLITYADRPELPVLATAIQAQWRELGINVTVRCR
jgi:peptide/nickel transport system substrate-binding protein